MSKCNHCNGTGVDAKKQGKYRKTVDFEMEGGYIQCWHCHGNGLEPYYPKAERKKDANIPSIS